MDQEDKEFIRRTLELTEENNKILRKMRSAMRWGRAWRIFYWVVVIGISIGAFYFIQPYIEQVLGIYSGLGVDVSKFNNFIGN